MDKFEIVNVPTQRVKANQASIGAISIVKSFSKELVADKVFHHKKKSSNILGIEEFEQEQALRNSRSGSSDDIAGSGFNEQLAILQNESEHAATVPETESKEDLQYLLQNLHMRTHDLIGKVTPAGMSRLAATNHVATAATRLKKKYMLEEDGVNSSGVAADAVALEDVTDSPEELKLSAKEKSNMPKRRGSTNVQSKSTGRQEQSQDVAKGRFPEAKKKSSLEIKTVKALRQIPKTSTHVQLKKNLGDSVLPDDNVKQKEPNATKKVTRRSSLK